MKTDEVRRKIDELWKVSKKEMKKVMENAGRLTKEGERYIKDKSEKGKKQLEIAAIALEREKLYYELGKTLAKTPKSKWTVNKKVVVVLTKIKSINIKIGQKKR